jgi:hypothetical protein
MLSGMVVLIQLGPVRVVLTKRKGSRHCILIASIVHHEIAKLGSKVLFANHFQNCHSDGRTVVFTVDAFNTIVLQLTPIAALSPRGVQIIELAYATCLQILEGLILVKRLAQSIVKRLF